MAITLTACGPKQQGGNAQTSEEQQSEAKARVEAAQPPASQSPTDRLLAAAEPFELLTETAFSDPPAKLDATIAAGHKAIAGVRPLLPAAVATKIDGLLKEVDRSRAGGKSADLAISSIEIYRALVSSVPAATKVPSDVSLLDYAGFRYQADLKAVPVRWDDMKTAASFGRDRWTAVAPKVKDKTVTGPFEAALADMETAAAKHDTALATSSVAAELDQVDKLEKYFGGL
ncbi:MAG: hypothetical protein ABIR51_03515 [Sphingomicrobium sp.]